MSIISPKVKKSEHFASWISMLYVTCDWLISQEIKRLFLNWRWWWYGLCIS